MADLDPDGKTIKITVEGDELAAEHFLSWLSGSGEQQYWSWMECREGEDSGPITAIRFSYNFKKGIATGKLGRLTPDFNDDED